MERKLSEGRHIPALDGLRGVAILLVLLFHTCSASPDRTTTWMSRCLAWCASIGWTGVDLFFVLSGFLITRILLDVRSADNYFRVFYARRVLRIFPIYYLSLIAFFLVWPMLSDHFAFFRLHRIPWYPFREQAWYWFDLVNLRTAFYPLHILLLTHYWTLSVEEQFYAVWPAVVFYLRERSLAIVCIAGIVVAMVLRILPWAQHIQASYSNFIYRLTPFRVDTLMMGALLAVVIRWVPQRKISRVAAATALLSLAALFLWGTRDIGHATFIFTGVGIFYTSVVALCVTNPAAGRLFETGILRGMGRYSYCVYLIHPVVIKWTDIAVGHWLGHWPVLPGSVYGSQVLTAVFDIGVCFVVARISWILIESPILGFKCFFRYSQSSSTASQ